MIFLMFVPFIANAGSDLDIRNQMLDSEIERLTKQRDEKYDALKKCEKSTKGFKIAGITTLVATGVGVGVNVALAKKLKEKEKTIECGIDTTNLLKNLEERNAQNFRWKPLNGDDGYTMESEYNEENSSDLNNGEWAVTFDYGTIKGVSTCSNRKGEGWNDSDEFVDTVGGNMISGDALQPGQYGGTDAKYCWCKATSYTPNVNGNVGAVCPLTSNSWVFWDEQKSSDFCAKGCAMECTAIDSYIAFRVAVVTGK